MSQNLMTLRGVQGVRTQDSREPIARLRRRQFSLFLSSVGIVHDATRPLDELKKLAEGHGINLNETAIDILERRIELPQKHEPDTLLPPSGPQEEPKPKTIMQMRKELQGRGYPWKDLAKMKKPELEARLGINPA